MCRELIEHSRHWLRCLHRTLSELHGTHPFKPSLPGRTRGATTAIETNFSTSLWPPFMVRFHITDSIPIVHHVILLHWMAGRPCIECWQRAKVSPGWGRTEGGVCISRWMVLEFKVFLHYKYLRWDLAMSSYCVQWICHNKFLLQNSFIIPVVGWLVWSGLSGRKKRRKYRNFYYAL